MDDRTKEMNIDNPTYHRELDASFFAQAFFFSLCNPPTQKIRLLMEICRSRLQGSNAGTPMMAAKALRGTTARSRLSQSEPLLNAGTAVRQALQTATSKGVSVSPGEHEPRRERSRALEKACEEKFIGQ